MKKSLSSAALICGILLSPSASFAFVWTEVPGPASPKNPAIYGLASVTSGDAWAVGGSGSQGGKTLIERWDGIAWNVVPGPIAGGQLYGVSAQSSTDVWAVGQTTNQTLVEHWDGMQWVRVPSPNIGSYDILYGVSAISSSDVWAVGYSLLPNYTYILMHWDGTTWSLVGAPPAGNSLLKSIKAFASDDVWAVGYKDYNANNNAASTFTLHWNGTAWSETPSPNVDASNYLSGVDGAASDDIWAVGNSGSGPTTSHTLVLHWGWRGLDGGADAGHHQ